MNQKRFNKTLVLVFFIQAQSQQNRSEIQNNIHRKQLFRSYSTQAYLLVHRYIVQSQTLDIKILYTIVKYMYKYQATHERRSSVPVVSKQRAVAYIQPQQSQQKRLDIKHFHVPAERILYPKTRYNYDHDVCDLTKKNKLIKCLCTCNNISYKILCKVSQVKYQIQQHSYANYKIIQPAKKRQKRTGRNFVINMIFSHRFQ
eukprot:TRINITY_DN6196_c0_g1_i3.p3 TRINITY_DN6196_c0_g1~~TRINITY_DN6196_c0_g1_i3.p3  ORF type:complete len:201 (+),score=-12.91 TRINITY_DN6196_c0_g1_i3:2660-3262(+)